MFPRIKQSKTLVEQAHEIIKKSIIKNKLKQGDLLIEEDLASQMGISRTPIRSALTQLSFEGLVEMESGKRARVSTITGKDIQDFLVIREVLEALAAELATAKMTGNLLTELENIVSEQKGCVEADEYTQFIELDRQFHSCIAFAADNKKLNEYLENLNMQLQRFLILTGTLQGAAHKAIEEHEKIIEAFRRKEAHGAKEAMLYHVRHVAKRLMARNTNH